MSERTAIVWFRRNLRLADNPALADAAATHDRVVPVYIIDMLEARWTPVGTSRAWLERSLAALDRSLVTRGSRLVILEGDPAEGLGALASRVGASAVYADRSWEPETAAIDEAIARALEEAGVAARWRTCGLLREPTAPMTSGGTPYKVFTPYHAATLRAAHAEGLAPAPSHLPLPNGAAGGAVPSGSLAPALLDECCTPGEDGARAALDAFLARAVASYPTDRDRPDLTGTSRLSAHLAFGEISPARVWATCEDLALALEGAPESARVTSGIDAFLRQLAWREFGTYLLHHFPHTATAPLDSRFEAMPWSEDEAGWVAWCAGQTGYPIIDAGMRELAATGWMHNRVRMIAASFLTKDLLLPWQRGERFFRERLTDIDPGNNVLGWQWVAGCGADAAPYFRVFNPMSQGEKFDPDGMYVRQWVPELAALPARWIHRPAEAPPGVLQAADVRIGVSYPAPIVDHADARRRALAAYEVVRSTKRTG